MRIKFLITLGVIVFLVGLFVSSWFLAAKIHNSIKSKYAEMDRLTFERSRAYNEDMERELERLMSEYQKATPNEKESLKTHLKNRFAMYPMHLMSQKLRNFYATILD